MADMGIAMKLQLENDPIFLRKKGYNEVVEKE
jgi:hypothetical protein